MTLPVVWIPEADADLKVALAWYESIHPDLGVRFALAVDGAVEVIAPSPLAFQIVNFENPSRGCEALPLRPFLQGGKQSDCGHCLHARAAQSETLETSAQ